MPGLSDTALGDWYVNRLVVDRQPLLLLVSATSLLPILVPARDVRGLPERLPGLVERRLQGFGLDGVVIGAEARVMRDVLVAPTVDRSVLGIMVDFAKAVSWYLEPVSGPTRRCPWWRTAWRRRLAARVRERSGWRFRTARRRNCSDRSGLHARFTSLPVARVDNGSAASTARQTRVFRSGSTRTRLGRRSVVAQLEGALSSGAKGRRFESCRAHHTF